MWNGALGNCQGRASCFTVLCLCVVEGLERGLCYTACPPEICLEGTCHPALTPLPVLHFLPKCHLSHLAGALVLNPRGGWVCMSHETFVSLSEESSVNPTVSSTVPTPCWFLQPEVIGIYLPGAWSLGWMIWSGAGITCSRGMPPNFYPPHVNVGLPVPLPLWASLRLSTSAHLSMSPSPRLDECGFFKSWVVGLIYSSIFWWIWVILVL